MKSVTLLILTMLIVSKIKPNSTHNLCAINDETCVQSLRFKILKIDSIESVYLIYASRNDSVFKILSKVGIQCAGRTLKVGNTYNFELTSLVPTIASKRHLGGMKYNGSLIRMEDGTIDGIKIAWNLYACKNLTGLCIDYSMKE